jgi:hypothetical protein
MIIFILSIFLGLLSVSNKIVLFLEKKSGWTSGIAIGLISGFYFWAIGLKILAIAEFGFFLVMLYGYVRHTRPSMKVTLWINLVLSIISLSLCYFLFTGTLTVIETVSSLSFIWGGYQLAIKYKITGWLLLLIAHLATATNSYYAGQTLFSVLQIVSSIVCMYALISNFSMRSRRVDMVK